MIDVMSYKVKDSRRITAMLLAIYEVDPDYQPSSMKFKDIYKDFLNIEKFYNNDLVRKVAVASLEELKNDLKELEPYGQESIRLGIDF